MRNLRVSVLSILLICLSSCKGIELDVYAGNDDGYIENIEQKKIYTSSEDFNKYGCMHVDEFARLAKYIKRNCTSK
jgi:hypothetical protein